MNCSLVMCFITLRYRLFARDRMLYQAGQSVGGLSQAKLEYMTYNVQKCVGMVTELWVQQ